MYASEVKDDDVKHTYAKESVEALLKRERIPSAKSTYRCYQASEDIFEVVKQNNIACSLLKNDEFYESFSQVKVNSKTYM